MWKNLQIYCKNGKFHVYSCMLTENQWENRSVSFFISGPTTFPVMKEFGYISITRVVVVFFFYITERILSDNFRKLEATTKGFLSKRGAIFSHTWSDTLKTKDDTQAVYCKFDMKIILMPLWKEKKAWTVDITRSLAMLQKNTLCPRSAHIEFRMHLKSLFNKCRRTVILIPTKLCQDEQNKKKYSRPASKQDRFCQHKNLTDQCLKFL